MMRAVSSRFGFTLPPPCLHFRSGGRAKAKRRQSGSDRLLYYTRKAQNQAATFEKKKWHNVASDDNNNNNNNRCEATVHSHFTPYFTNSKENIMTDSYIRSTVHCSLYNAMNFGFLIGI